MFSKKIASVRRFVNVTSEIDAIYAREESRSARSVAVWTIGVYAAGLAGLALYSYLREQKELVAAMRSRLNEIENLPAIQEEQARRERQDRIAKAATAAREYEELRAAYNMDGTKKVEKA